MIPILCTAALSLAASLVQAQELTAPVAGLAISWRSPAVPSMPTVTWKVTAVDGPVATVRTEARTLFERMTSDSSIYRVIFPLRSVDPFGTVYECEYDRAALDAIGQLDAGKQVRIAVKSVSTITQTRQPVRREYAGFTVLTVERHEILEVPAGRFDTVVLRIEGEGGVPASPVITQMYRRYWYAPALGWYVRHEVVAIGPNINQRNEYVAVKITPLDASAQRR